jgi:hypothetical protein
MDKKRYYQILYRQDLEIALEMAEHEQDQPAIDSALRLLALMDERREESLAIPV